MRRASVLVVPLILFTLQTVLGFDGVKTAIGTTSLHAQLVIAGSLIVLFAAHHFGTVNRGYLRFVHFDKTKTHLIDQPVQDLLGEHDGDRNKMRVNVMMAHRVIVALQEPMKRFPNRRKISIFPKVLSVVYESPNMRHDGDRILKFTTKQGLCGKAFKKRQTLVTHPKRTQEPFYLNVGQKESTADIQTIISTPIWEFDHEKQIAGKHVIGVVSIDCSSTYLLGICQNPKNYAALEKKCEALSQFCMLLY